MKIHRVKQGECLSSIAGAYGFSSYRTIYEHPDNTQFRKKRPDPAVIFPGDQISIPDRELKYLSAATDARHKMVVGRPQVTIRVHVRNRAGQPLKHADYELRFNNEVIQGTTNSDGLMKAQVPVSLAEVGLALPKFGIKRRLRLRELDPVDTHSGVRSRLNSLGYDIGLATGEADARFKAAVSEFQKSESLKSVSGEINDDTRQALLKRFGS